MPPPSQEELDACPFCAGREERTPPETFALGPPGRAPGSPGWWTRVVPNLYPAFDRQEVAVHTPRHMRSLAELTPEELQRVAETWQARALAARAEGFGYLHAFVNEGRDAGASLPHSHSQLLWLPGEPPVPAAEQRRAGAGCSVCAALEQELRDEVRLVAEHDGLVLLCPYAGRMPYELLIAPVEHEADGFASTRLPAALRLLAEALRRLHAVEGRCSANAWLHTSPLAAGAGHWHLEVLPRLAILAGVELGAGYYVNSLPPETAAAALRGAGS